METLLNPKEILRDRVIIKMKNEIRLNNGKEVLFRAYKTDQNRTKFNRVKVISRGIEHAVNFDASRYFPGDIMIHNHPTGNLEASFSDINSSQRWFKYQVGFYICNNEVSKMFEQIKFCQNPSLIENFDCVFYDTLKQSMEEGSFDFFLNKIEHVKTILKSGQI